MEEGILPHKRSIDATDREIDEERRLCYVAITRARDHLTLTRAVNRRKWGKLRPSQPSRFLREMRVASGQDDDGAEDDPAAAATQAVEQA
jgi:superfamily I DNA/RNA helicase